jgi:XTP/dITP diphosphohydrolase
MNFLGTPLVLATHNQGKIKELSKILSPFFLNFSSSKELNIEEPEETGQTFEDNAILKAIYTRDATHSLSLADDSGLSVEALGGKPGVYSARWAGDSRDFHAAMNRINDELIESDNKNASFICVLALAFPDNDEVLTFRGECKGTLIWPPQGKDGFGYDPFFVPHGYNQTFAQMSPDEKNAISHRARAIENLVKYLKKLDL